MREDEIIIIAVGVMLLASIFMGLSVKLSLNSSRRTFLALLDEIAALNRRVAELENGSGGVEQTRSRPRPLN